MPDIMSNEELIRKIMSEQEKERTEALSYIYQQIKPSILANFLRRGGNREAFDDFFQDAIIEVIERLRKGEELRKLAGYLWTIVFRQAFGQGAPPPFVGVENLQMEDSTPIPTALLENKQTLDMLNTILDQIDGRCWNLFEHRLYKFKWDMISQIQEITIGAAKMRHKRCMEKLVEWLNRHPALRDDLGLDLSPN